MKVKYNINSQDITLFLDKKEFEELGKKAGNEDFFHNCIRAQSHEAGAHFFLSFNSLDTLFNDVEVLDKGTQIKLPQELADPYLINLGSETYKELKLFKQCTGIRYLGGSNLIIILKE